MASPKSKSARRKHYRFEQLERRDLMAVDSMMPFNPIFPEDTLADGQLTALDALVVINQINLQVSENTRNVAPMPDGRIPAVDVDGDGNVAARDALLVINRINLNSGSSQVPVETRVQKLRAMAAADRLPSFINAQRVDQLIAELESGSLPELDPAQQLADRMARLARPLPPAAEEQLPAIMVAVRLDANSPADGAAVGRNSQAALAEILSRVGLAPEEARQAVARLRTAADSATQSTQQTVQAIRQTLDSMPVDRALLADELAGLKDRWADEINVIRTAIDNISSQLNSSSSIDDVLATFRNVLQQQSGTPGGLPVALTQELQSGLDWLESRLGQVDSLGSMSLAQLIAVGSRWVVEAQDLISRLRPWESVVELPDVTRLANLLQRRLLGG